MTITKETLWTFGANENQYGFYVDLGQAYFQFDQFGKHYLADASGKKMLDLQNITTIEQLQQLKDIIDTRIIIVV